MAVSVEWSVFGLRSFYDDFLSVNDKILSGWYLIVVVVVVLNYKTVIIIHNLYTIVDRSVIFFVIGL